MRIQIPGSTLVMAVCLCTGVYAKDCGDDEEWSDYKYAAGVTVSAEHSLYLDGDDNFRAEPVVIAGWGPVHLNGAELCIELYDGNHWSLSTGIILDFTRDTERGDSPQAAGMEELDDVILGQVDLAFGDVWGKHLSLALASDISDKHEGYIVELSYGNSFELGHWIIEPEMGITWHSSNVMRYYYGVGPTDVVLPTRPLYEPGSGVIYELRVATTYPFGKRTGLRFEFETELFPDAVTDSPIVARDYVVEIGIGYYFRF